MTDGVMDISVSLNLDELSGPMDKTVAMNRSIPLYKTSHSVIQRIIKFEISHDVLYVVRICGCAYCKVRPYDTPLWPNHLCQQQMN